LQKHKFITFTESYSYLGACCSFNYNPKATENDEHFRSNFFGINGGLSVIGTGEKFT
jgi:acid-sensing ion channel, other